MKVKNVKEGTVEYEIALDAVRVKQHGLLVERTRGRDQDRTSCC